MSGRCKCCNEQLSDEEMCRTNPISGEYEDTCTSCLFDIQWCENNPQHIAFYQFEGAREGLQVVDFTDIDKS